MSAKKFEAIFWLSVACTEVIMYLMILVGVSGIFYGVFKTMHIAPIGILATMIEIFSIWLRHTQGFYVRAYKKHVCKEEVL